LFILFCFAGCTNFLKIFDYYKSRFRGEKFLLFLLLLIKKEKFFLIVILGFISFVYSGAYTKKMKGVKIHTPFVQCFLTG